MKPTALKSILSLAMLPLAASTSLFATDYIWNAGAWAPGPPPGAPDAVPLAGDRIILQSGGPAIAGQIIINPGAEFQKTNPTNYGFAQHMDIAGTGVDGNGAYKNLAGNWSMPQSVRLTGDALFEIGGGGGWRHQDGANIFNLNGQDLTVQGNGNWYFVNTNLQGPGTITVNNFGGEFNWEGSSVLPAGVTLNVNNSRISSWDGGGDNMAGDINSNGGVFETRHNDHNKTFSGNITTTGTTTFRTNWSGDAGSPQQNDINVTGPISGSGSVVKDGNSVGVLHLANAANSYTGGTVINAGALRLEAAGAIPAGSAITVGLGASLDLNTFNQNIGSGTISGSVIGGGTLMKTGPGTLNLAAGAVLSNTGGLNLAGGVTRTHGLGGISGPLIVSENSTLKPVYDVQSVQGLSQWERDGSPPADAAAFQAGDFGTAGAVMTGITDGPIGIDTVGNHETFSYIYQGEIINTTGGNVGVMFAEQYDDNVKVKVDGVTVVNDGGWNVATTSPLVDLGPGAHTVEFSSYEGGGGEGPNTGWTKGVGIRGGAYVLQDPDGDGNNGATAGSLADNAAFLQINQANLASLGLSFGVINTVTGVNTDSKAININSGKTLTVDTSEVDGGLYTMTGNFTGSGRLAKTGAGKLTLTGTTTTRNASVIEGTLALNGTHAFSSISVASGATLEGSGSAASAVINVDVGADVAPGNSVGTITVGTISINGSYAAEASGNGVNDLIIGDVIWGGTGSFDLTLTGGYVPVVGDSFDFIDGFIDGGPPALNLPDLGFAKEWNDDLFLSDGILSVQIPEPASALLAGLGLVFLARRRR